MYRHVPGITGLLAMGCTPEMDGPGLVPGGDDVWVPASDTDPTVSDPEPEACDPDAPDPGGAIVSIEPHASSVHQVWATVGTQGAAEHVVTCRLDGHPDERLLWTQEGASTDRRLLLSGLLAGQTYHCEATATCPRSASSPTPFEITTPPLPADMPEIQVFTPGEPTATVPHLVVNHVRHCEGDPTHRLLVYDLEGNLRWSYHLPRNTPIAANALYVGNGEFVWGGGWTRQGDPEVIGVDHHLRYKLWAEGTDALTFHHEGRMLTDGTLLGLTNRPNALDGNQWEGFHVWVVDPATGELTFDWNSQRAVDDGILAPGTGDVYHANAADIVDTDEGPMLLMSLCFSLQVLGIDVATGDVRWDFRPGGDFDLFDVDGSPLTNWDYPDCQHGIEFADNRLLVYDNGRYFRGYSRAVEYELDVASGRATMLWEWTEPGWWEGGLGDIDWLAEGRVLITKAHADCWSGNPGDVSASIEVDQATNEVVWRHQFIDPQDATYRSERFDGCDIFPQAKFCPAVAAELLALEEAGILTQQ